MSDEPWMALLKALDAVYCSGAVESVEEARVATDAVLFSLRRSGYVLTPADRSTNGAEQIGPPP